MRYGWITTNLLDLRAEPGHHSERISQLLFGESIRVGKSESGFLRIRQMDGYSGWVDARFVALIGSKQDYDGYCSCPRRVLVTSKTRIYNTSGRSVAPYVLYYGTHLAIKGKVKQLVRLNLPGRTGLFVKGRNLRPINSSNAKKVTGPRLVAEGRKFLGVPYLWGGVSPMGFDCSGLVQAVYGSYGLVLPRDTVDQVITGCEVAREGVRSGDLLFFDRHVALAIDRNRFIHASRGSGGVRIESLSTEDADYRADLDREFVQARRVLQ
ncbi:MAG: C40 family peptidase [candidate division Zixibacteria bacterium]|nr:C40 family peptidase [candidate division Zixibacteria bacterium]